MHKKILIAMDDSDVVKPAVDEGLLMAKTFGADVVFFYVLPAYSMPLTDMPYPATWSPEDHLKVARKQAMKALSAASALATRAGIKSHQALGSDHDVAECISKAAVTRKCDLIVIGSHGRTAFQRLLLGSIVTRLITIATLPLVVCKKRNARRPAVRQRVPAPVIKMKKKAPRAAVASIAHRPAVAAKKRRAAA